MSDDESPMTEERLRVQLRKMSEHLDARLTLLEERIQVCIAESEDRMATTIRRDRE